MQNPTEDDAEASQNHPTQDYKNMNIRKKNNHLDHHQHCQRPAGFTHKLRQPTRDPNWTNQTDPWRPNLIISDDFW